MPAVKEQIRITTLLSRVDVLINTRKDNLQLLDDFLKSTFLEMFGDPVKNEKEWKKKEIDLLLSNVESGWSPKCEARQVNDGEWGVLKLGAVTKCTYDDSENKALPENVEPKEKNEINKGDILFSRKNTYELIAACAYVFKTKEKLMMSDLIFRLVINDTNEINPLYLWKLLTNNRQRRAIQSLAGGAAGSMPNISKQKLKFTRIPVPPITLQNKFSTIVEKVETIKSQYQQNLTELENLYGSLSQKAFKGELDLSRIPLPNTMEGTVIEPVVEVKTEIEQAEYSVPKPETHQILLRKLFDAFTLEQKEKTFLLDDFWQYAETNSQEYMDEDSQALGLSDYEHTKQWLFDLIENGKIEQQFVDDSKQIKLKVKG